MRRVDPKFVFSALVAVLAACNGSTPTPPAGDNDGKLPPGRTCETNEECESGWCVEFPAGRACAYLCPGGECDGGLVCKRADGRDRDAATICVPATSSLCQTCASDTDCGLYGDLCLPLDPDKYCTLDCSATLQCPEGYTCESFRDDQGQELSRQCFPITGTCSCTGSNAGMERPCEWLKPGVGVCRGNEVCQPGVGWVSCDAPEPFYEDCDGYDDDCDGLTDEQINGAPLQRECGYGPTPRRQECTSVEVCIDGFYSVCQLPEPPAQEYSCDGLDDDCDGDVDDGLLHSTEYCTSCDDDPCPPGADYDGSTVRSCLSDSGSYFCGPIGCRVPNFDVDGLEANGCEVEDDHEQVGEDVVLNATWPEAFDIGDGSVSCNDSDFLVACGLRIPSDDRQHVPVAPPSPNVDYHRFFMSGGVCTVETRVCAFVTGAAAFPGASVEICASDSVANTTTAPTFDPARCATLDFTPNNFVTITPVLSRDEYVYVRVRSLGANYGGTYALATFEDAAGCVLATAGDPCSY